MLVQHDAADAERFERVIVESVRHILEHPDPRGYLAWADDYIPTTLGLWDFNPDPAEVARLTRMIATLIWNAVPLPSNDFRPRPLPQPASDDPCLCGSGLRYGQCCGNLDALPPLSTELVWDIVIDLLSEEGIRAALASGAIPEPLLARIADRWLDADRPGRVVALLEPLFAGSLGALDGRYEPALDLLCDAYDRLNHWRKKLALLQRVCEEGSRTLKSAAWQRLGTMHIDAGDYALAQEAYIAALRSDPDNPGTALLEITLLVSQHKNTEARERARFWYHRFKRRGIESERLMEFLRQVMVDPQRAMIDTQADVLDPALVELRDWVAVAMTRPLPDYTLINRRRRARSGMPARTPQFELFDGLGARGTSSVADDGVIPEDWRESGCPFEVRAPIEVRSSETLWRRIYPGGKPRSIHLTLSEELDVWSEPGWLEYLLDHPELADSLDVLDDLATALYAHPESALPWVAHALLTPVLDRGWSILERALPSDTSRRLPWSIEANRPALRLLFRRSLAQTQEGRLKEARRTLETLLRLNPEDNHGVRAELMNLYLRDGENERALALARCFPGDRLADLAYGEVLALYRLGHEERARTVLETAIRRLPRIPHYLTRKRIKPPRLNPFGFTLGGEDQAWLYREAMRDVWAAEPGVLDWLKRCLV
ncbi:MAG: SEC-C metal-binding domain-containing protein [Thermochromatium sp.]